MKSSRSKEHCPSARWSHAGEGWGLRRPYRSTPRSWWVDAARSALWRGSFGGAFERRSLDDPRSFECFSSGEPIARIEFVGSARPVAIVATHDAIEQWTFADVISRRVLARSANGPFERINHGEPCISILGARVLISASLGSAELFELTHDDELARVASIDARSYRAVALCALALVGDRVASIEGSAVVLRSFDGVEVSRIEGVVAHELVPIDDRRVLARQQRGDLLIRAMVLDFHKRTQRILDLPEDLECCFWVCGDLLCAGYPGGVSSFSIDGGAPVRAWCGNALMSCQRDGVLFGSGRESLIAVDVRSAQTVMERPIVDCSVESLAFDADGTRLFALSLGGVRVLDARDGTMLSEQAAMPIDRAALSSNEGWREDDGGDVFLRETYPDGEQWTECVVTDAVAGPRIVWRHPGVPFAEWSVRVDRAARTIVVLWSRGSEATVHDFEGRELARWTVVEPWDEVRSMALSPDGRTLAVGTLRGAVRAFVAAR